MSALAPGTTLHDRFTVRERIGVGGMSEVWRADDRVLGRAVAVKALSIPLTADPLLRAATWREARAAARLTHPHVTQVYDYGEASLPSGAVVAYLVMELVAGVSLADRLRSGPLPWPEAARMGAQVAAALTAAHDLGIVHRDVKPGNVMLTPTGTKVLDFGIAALVGGGPDADRGLLVGTPAYAAPERLQAAPAAPASDVYALGALLYEALTGHQAIPAATWQDAAAARRAGVAVPPLDVPGLPRAVTRLCLACLAPDPAERPTAEELAAGLTAAAGQPPVSTASPPPNRTTVIPAVAAPPPAAGYAVGSAPLPHPPTMIEPPVALAEPLDAVSPRRSPRPLTFSLIATVVVLGLALAAVTAALLSGTASRTAAPAPASSTVSTTSPPSPAPSSSPPASPTSAAAIVDQLDQTITDALAAGRIDVDAAQMLRDKLNDLRNSLGRGRARKQAEALKRTIDQLLRDDKIDQGTADQLTAFLDTLTAGA